MAVPQNYQRDINGIRFEPGGIDTVHPLDALPPRKYGYLQNVRAYKQLQITGRATESAALVSSLPTPVHSLRLLNDTTPDGPVAGYVRVIGAAGAMYVNSTQVASGLSTNPISLCPFRPNASPQSWMYVGDSAPAPNVSIAGGISPVQTATSSTSTGTSVGGGVAWANPTNIDSNSSFATATLSVGGSTYTPSTTSGSATASSYSNTPGYQATTLSGFSSVAATSATLYVTIQGNMTAGNVYEGDIALAYSTNSGVTWLTTNVWYTSFATVTIPIALSGITNLDTVQIQMQAFAVWVGEPGTVTVTVTVSNWYAVIAGASGLYSQTLNAAITGLSVPSNATIVGFGLSFNGKYATLLPSLSVALSVGTEIDSYTLTTSPATYTGGGPTDLWGYNAWTPATLSSLAVQFTASAGAASVISLNTLATTVYYTVPAPFTCAGMLKVRSDGLIYKTGIKEPQLAPVVTTQNTNVPVYGTLPATAIPWTNYPTGTNPNFDYGETEGPPNTTPPVDGTAPLSVDCANASTITITALSLNGTVVINGNTNPSLTTTSPSWVVPGAPGFPGQFLQTLGSPTPPSAASLVVGAFTDGQGNVMAAGVAPLYIPSVVDVGAAYGASAAIPVPYGAQQFQIGINSEGNTFTQGTPPINSGNIAITVMVTTNALPSVTSILGTLALNYWGDSPTSGPVSAYIWKNPDDPGGSGPARTISNAVGSATGNSFIFDATFNYQGSTPPPHTGPGIPGLPGIGSPTVPMEWTSLNPESVAVGTNAVFAAPITTPYTNNTSFQNFNFCLTGSIYFPAAGHYTFNLTNHDDLIWGIDGVTLVSATSVDSGGGGTTPAISGYGQTITVVGGYPLLPRCPYAGGVGGHWASANVTVNAPAAGIYPIEVDYDYWYHSGRILLLMASPTPGASATIIPPLPAGVREQVQYRYTYRSSATGAVSNPSPESTAEAIPVLANTITSLWSNDPQVDLVDYYRMDAEVENFTYVATGPNDNLGGGGSNGTNTPITDSLSDTAAAANPLLAFDNYEPFPVTDLPQKGRCNVSGGVITWLSGGAIGPLGSATGFNMRWLPGTVIQIGSPTALAYSFIARPTSTTSVTIPGVPDGTNLAYSIPEPILAAQPLPYLWGPTDNAAYMFGVGDKLNPGTLYFTMGNNPDSAPETNQIPVTSPAEPLQNGCITAGLGMVFSTERRWLIYPTFTTALATVSGVAGSPFNLVLASSDRGLYIPTCLYTDGGNRAFFRAKDGIYSCAFGGGDEFLCADIYNLFPREGVTPQAITVAGYTLHPPDDTKPSAQKLAYANGYLYYDYEDTTATPRTLVYDTIAQGWSVDVGQYPFTVHALEEGPRTNTVMVGCTDGSVRVLGSGNAETATSAVIPGCQNAGEARAFKRIGDVFIKAVAKASNPIAVGLYANRYAQALTGFSPASLTGTGSLLPYIVDFTAGFGDDLIDVGVSLSWPTAAGNILDLWQPDWINLPESTQDRPTDWDDGGYGGNKFVQGMLLEADSFNVGKVVTVQRSDDLSILTPNESPITYNGQSTKALTFTPPFLAHSMRIVTTDGVPWRKWGVKWIYQPFPEATVEWQSEFTSHGMPGWQHIREMNIAYQSTAALTLTLGFGPESNLAPITLTIPSSSGVQTKYKTPVPANKYKLIAYGLNSTAAFYLFREQCEAKVKAWGDTGPYSIIKPFGGPEKLGAEV